MDLHTTSPLKLFEYMAAARPIVATNTPTITKVLTHDVNSILTKSRDIDTFCEGITSVIDNTNLANKLSSASKSKALEFSWDSRCRKVIQLINTAWNS